MAGKLINLVVRCLISDRSACGDFGNRASWSRSVFLLKIWVSRILAYFSAGIILFWVFFRAYLLSQCRPLGFYSVASCICCRCCILSVLLIVLFFIFCIQQYFCQAFSVQVAEQILQACWAALIAAWYFGMKLGLARVLGFAYRIEWLIFCFIISISISTAMLISILLETVSGEFFIQRSQQSRAARLGLINFWSMILFIVFQFFCFCGSCVGVSILIRVRISR